MSNPRVVDIDVFTIDTLPPRLAAIAAEQGFILGSDLIIVTTECCPVLYAFEAVGSSPEEILAYMKKVARRDGVDLNNAVKRAFAEYHGSEQLSKEAEIHPEA